MYNVNSEGLVIIAGVPFITLSRILADNEGDDRLAWYNRVRRFGKDRFVTRVVKVKYKGESPMRETVVRLSDYERYIEQHKTFKNIDKVYSQLKALNIVTPVLIDSQECIGIREAVAVLLEAGHSTAKSTLYKLVNEGRLDSKRASINAMIVIPVTELDKFGQLVKTRLN